VKDGLRRAALEMKAAYEAVSPFIEEHTSTVCPSCKSVCCIDRHGAHEEEDIAFVAALGEALPPEKPRADDTEPCRHLCPEGCRLPRWQRPFRCTWYFCTALLEAMPRDNPRRYRSFMAELKRLQSLRMEITTLFSKEKTA
jgi:hypothetical protein